MKAIVREGRDFGARGLSDTLRGTVDSLAKATLLGPMTKVRRPNHEAAVQLNARVMPEVRMSLKEAAKASGLSVALYLDIFIGEILRDNGSLPVVQNTRSERPMTTG